VASALPGSPSIWAATSPTVLDVLRAFNASRLVCLQEKSLHAHRIPLDFASFQPSARRPAPKKNVPDSAKKGGVLCPDGIPLCMRCDIPSLILWPKPTWSYALTGQLILP
jgi:hypothetical protein